MGGTEPILAVDDSASIREMIITILGSRGHRVAGAADGRQAVDYLRAAPEPHIVLLDIIMPVLDGIGVCHEIAADPALRAKGHRIILMSSTVRLSASDVPEMVGQLIKPFTRQQLIEAVELVRIRV